VTASRAEQWAGAGSKTAFNILAVISVCHLLNDMLGSLLPSIYPLLKISFHLSFTQIGIITLTYQTTASLLQPLVGLHIDRNPSPYSLPVGMGVTLVGLLLLAWAHNFSAILIASAMVGVGSAVFHPESSRVARLASGGRHGLAQSIFQLGGNAGLSLGPLLTAFIVVPRGQSSVAWFSLAALLAMMLLATVSGWAKRRMRFSDANAAQASIHHPALSTGRVIVSVVILMALLFSKFVYLACMTSYYTFFLIDKFQLTVKTAQIYLFLFLGAVAVGTILGGPIGDRIGRKSVIWCSILGILPFTVLLPYASLFWTAVLSIIIGLILASAFAVIVVYAQELVPGRVGMISGLCFGFAFGVGGLGAAMLGKLADLTNMNFVFLVCSYLPAVGLLTTFLPELEPMQVQVAEDIVL
jgi:FSR family fosmidomycin resistance protein-like MFS transporter